VIKAHIVLLVAVVIVIVALAVVDLVLVVRLVHKMVPEAVVLLEAKMAKELCR
jgi:hypothetical protein